MTQPIGQPSNVYSILPNLVCLFGLRISGVSPQASHAFRHFRELSSFDTYVLLRIKFRSFTLGGICPILLHPNTRDLLLLLFYTTVSLDFGRCPIFELTTHSPRMVNNSTMHPHPTQRNVTVHMKCNRAISCYVMLYATFINFG